MFLGQFLGQWAPAPPPPPGCTAPITEGGLIFVVYGMSVVCLIFMLCEW